MIQDLIDIGELATRVEQSALGKPRAIVGIDGPGAAGKTSLAQQLAAVLGNAYLVHVDDFYLPSVRRSERRGEIGALFDLPRLAEQVVFPATSGRSLRYQRYDWAEDALTQWLEIPPGAPVILEGVFCLAAGLREHYTFSIWCHAELEVRLARGLERDGEQARSLWVDLWMPAEDDYIAQQQPERFADVAVEVAPELQRSTYRIVAPGSTH